MPPLPKRKYAKARQGDRRRHLGVAEPNLVECSGCRRLRQSHHACPHCGQYRGRQVIATQASGRTD
ncbi:MAG: 50S ribosomal protein L32 [Chloroflexi bacterium]|nr:50S ribosomal protein L32 [Chloroflexota bacterium]